MLDYCSKPLLSSTIADKCYICSKTEVFWKFFSVWSLFHYVSGCALGLSMVSGYKVFTLWPMTSPWKNLQGLYELAFVWTHFSRLLLLVFFAKLVLDTFLLLQYAIYVVVFHLPPYFYLEKGKLNGGFYILYICYPWLLSFVYYSIFYHIFLYAGFFYLSLGNMSCKLETTIALSPIVIVQALVYVFLDRGLSAQLAGFCGLSLGSDHGLLLNLAFVGVELGQFVY